MKSIFHESVTVQAIQSRRQGFAKLLGVEFLELGIDFLKASLLVTEKHLRSGGIMNGGVSLGMIETVGSTACGALLFGTGSGQDSLGIQVSASHLRAARTGDLLTAIARPKHLGRKMHVWEVSIENQENKPVSVGTLTLMIKNA